MPPRDFPPPMVPAEIDLRGYEYMPFYGDRLFKSHTWIKASAEARCAMLRLWWHAFAHEGPPAGPSGSLPDDDLLLAEYAGSNVKAWPSLRVVVLSKWAKCSDGRLYHPVVAAIVMQSWEVKLSQQNRTAHARAARQRNRVVPPVADSVTDSVTEAVTSSVTESNIEESIGDKRNEVVKAPFVLPDWIPAEAWSDYLAMRVKVRKPMTSRAMELAVEKLAELQSQGCDPRAVLNQSILNSWQGLFAVRVERGARNRQVGVEERNSTVAQQWRPKK
jgi:hypothetical protein